MIFLMSGLVAAMMCLLPIWTLPIICSAIGFAYLYNWRQAFRFALIASLIVVVVAAGLDLRNELLVSKRIGGAMALPWFLVPLLPGILTMWIAVFFARLGSTVRIICKKRTVARS